MSVLTKANVLYMLFSWLTQVDLYNSHKLMVVVVVLLLHFATVQLKSAHTLLLAM